MVELLPLLPLPDAVAEPVQMLPARHVVQQDPADLPALADEPEPRHGSRQEDEPASGDGLLPLIRQQGPSLVVAHHQDVKFGSVAANEVVIPQAGEAGQEDARLPQQGQAFAPSIRSSQPGAISRHSLTNAITPQHDSFEQESREMLTVKPLVPAPIIPMTNLAFHIPG